MRHIASLSALALAALLLPVAGIAGPATALEPAGATVTAAAPAAAASSASTTTGRLTVRLKGVASGRSVKVKVTGPTSYSRTFTLAAGHTRTLASLRPGTYTVRAGDSTITSGTRKGVYWTPVARVGVSAARTASRTLTYRKLTLTPTTLGPLKIGMTWEQAKKADPSLTVTDKSECLIATSRYGTIAFNGPQADTLARRLSYIGVGAQTGAMSRVARVKLVPTSRGVSVGDPMGAMYSAYPVHSADLDGSGFTTAYVKNSLYTRYQGRYQFFYGYRSGDEDVTTVPATRPVEGLALDAGQRCFG